MFRSQGKILKKVAFSARFRQSPGNFLREKWHFLRDSAAGRFCKMVFGRISGLCQKSTLPIFLSFFEKCPRGLLPWKNGQYRCVEVPEAHLLSAGRPPQVWLARNYSSILVPKRTIFPGLAHVSKVAEFSQKSPQNLAEIPAGLCHFSRRKCHFFPQRFSGLCQKTRPF